MLTARATGQSARFCGQYPGPKGQAYQKPEYHVQPLSPHPHHLLSTEISGDGLTASM